MNHFDPILDYRRRIRNTQLAQRINNCMYTGLGVATGILAMTIYQIWWM